MGGCPASKALRRSLKKEGGGVGTGRREEGGRWASGRSGGSKGGGIIKIMQKRESNRALFPTGYGMIAVAITDEAGSEHSFRGIMGGGLGFAPY